MMNAIAESTTEDNTINAKACGTVSMCMSTFIP